MTNITTNLVKELREQTGVGMMDCKKALVETKGDFKAAIDWLRQKGLSSAAKKSSRTAAEGLVAISIKDKKAAIVELNSETDFVARNEKFQQLAEKIAKVALTVNNVEELKLATYIDTNHNVQNEIVENIAVIGENISLRRMKKIEIEQGSIAYYLHNSVTDHLGRIGVLVALSGVADQNEINKLGKQIAMHIAASKPEFLSVEKVDKDVLERERKIFSEQARTSGKPDSIIEKMVEGRIRKYYEESVLLEQIFVIDGKTKISDILAAASKDLGSEISIKDFVIFKVGEGIEHEASNFADEVKSMIL